MKTVTAALIRREDFYLVTKRAAGQNLEGFWEFPGGKLEQDETLYECVEREILEELGLVVRAADIFCESIHTYEKGQIKLVAIMASIISGTLRLSVHDDFRWCFPQEILDLKLAPADIPIAQRLRNYHGN